MRKKVGVEAEAVLSARDVFCAYVHAIVNTCVAEHARSQCVC